MKISQALSLPLLEKINPGWLNGKRILRPLCTCCGGSIGVRKAWRKGKYKRAKPKYKSHRLAYIPTKESWLLCTTH